MRVMLFLGSGASTPLGYMTTAQMKDHLIKMGLKRISGDLAGSILQTPFNDIEYLYYALYSIDNYLSNPINSMFFENLMFTHNILVRQRTDNISLGLFKELVREVLGLMEGEIYTNYRWKPAEEDNLLQLYGPIISILKNNYELVIGTTNYDKSIETFCRLVNHIYYDGFKFDGFGSLIFEGFNEVPNDRTLYLKIHGSLDWKESQGRIIKTSEESKPSDSNFNKSLWIAPTLYGKTLDTRPFGEIFGKFKEELEQSDACICIGYSFRDNIVKDEFKRFIDSDKNLYILDPNPGNIIKELDIPLNVSEMKLENPDIVGNFIEHENITFIPLRFRADNIKEIIEEVDIMINNQQN